MGWKSTLVGGALVAMLAATGCSGGGGAKVATLDGGGSDQSSQSDDSSSSSTSFEDAFVAYTGCMRDHGIDMPDPTFQPNGSGSGGFAVTAAGGSGDGGPAFRPDSAEFKAADDACKPLLDAAMKNAPKPTPEELAEQTDKMLAFAKCMRDHGIDMPDPVIGGDGSVQVQAGGPSSASDGATSAPGPDPAFEAAAKECAPENGPGFGVITGGDGADGGGMSVSNGAKG